MLAAPLLNSAVDAFKIPDLRRKLIFTMAMLVAFRFIAHIPVPGADVDALSRVFQTNQLAGFFDLFSGGALSSLSIAALGVYPYITAQIIMQIMQPAIPKLQEVAREGESGRQKINQWTHWLTVPLALFQAYGTPNLINYSYWRQHPDHQELRLRRRPARHAGDHRLDDGRHHAAGVDGRADHAVRRGSGCLDHHLRRHHGPPAVPGLPGPRGWRRLRRS